LIQTLVKNWWLLALCGILEAILSVAYFIMQGTNGPLTFHAWRSTLAFLGEVSMAAGVCSIAAGVWRSATGKSWPLVLNGLALGAFGVIGYGFTSYRISLSTIALLIIVMAMSTAILELTMARTLRGQGRVREGWFLGLAGAVSAGFALPFLILAFGWIRLGQGSHADLLWFGSYFGFSAVCLVGLALRLHSLGTSQSGRWESVPPLRNPKHAH
jgi:uncharacterized membrane protein HdeD (DUF308 family)